MPRARAASGRAWGLMWESPDIWRPSCCGRSRRGLGLVSPSCVAALAAASGSSAPPAVAAPAAASGSLAPSPASLRPRSPPLQPTPPRGVSSVGGGVAARHGSPAVGVTGATTTPGCSQACGAFASSSTNLINKYRRSRCAPRVSGQAGCFWARDASPTPSGLQRAHRGPGGYCRRSGNQGTTSRPARAHDTLQRQIGRAHV